MTQNWDIKVTSPGNWRCHYERVFIELCRARGIHKISRLEILQIFPLRVLIVAFGAVSVD